MLFPLPEEPIARLLGSYPALESVCWVQEEPRNMGAWDFVRRQIERLLPAGVALGLRGTRAPGEPQRGLSPGPSG